MSDFTPDPEALVVGRTKFKYEKIVNQFMEKDIQLSFDAEDTPTGERFGIVATMSGIRIYGHFDLSTMKELQQFANLVSEAWKARSSLKLKLATTVSGH